MYAPSYDLSGITTHRAKSPSRLYVDHASVYAFIPRAIHIYLCPILAYCSQEKNPSKDWALKSQCQGLYRLFCSVSYRLVLGIRAQDVFRFF